MKGNHIVEHRKGHRFFINLNGKLAKLDYTVSEDGKILDYESTFVPEELRGQGIGDELVLFALDYAKDNGFKVMPTCPFVKTIAHRHPEYRSLLIEE
jgi:uncharacterized protein